MNAYLLDTNALLWVALDRRALSPKAREILFDATLYASVVSGIEIAIKSALGKLPLPPPFETDFEAAFRLLLEKSAVDLLTLIFQRSQDCGICPCIIAIRSIGSSSPRHSAGRPDGGDPRLYI